jgi:hypothetical protein
MTLYEYFQSTNNYFWQWEYDDIDDNEVISIPGGNTIAYKKMVVDIIDKLSLQGTPYFGSLLLLIVATNPNSENDLERIRQILSFELKRHTVFTDSNNNKQILSDAVTFLKLVSQIPKEYKVGANRILLFQTLIRKSHNFLSYKKIRPLVKLIQSKRYEQERLISPTFLQETAFFKDFRPISLLAKKFFTVEEIIAQMGDLFPIEEELLIENTNTDEKPKLDFVEELIENTNTFHVGTLLKRIWSGLNVPFHNVLPSQQPIGGVSDLTNKGNFDRLLISEFANDDIVFLSRIANNEALYINREVPPQSEELERIILIDVSIKNWGTPKLLAHALLLAIAKHPKSSIHCTAYAVGETYQPLNFNTIHEIIKGVQYLEGCLEASNGLTAFFSDNPTNKNNEIFFITTTDAVKSAVVQKVLSDNHSAVNYWIYTDSEGKIDLFKKQHSSRKHIQTLKLPLEELWTKKAKVEVVKDVPKVDNKPIFYNILFPKQNKVKCYLPTRYANYYIVDNYLLADMGATKGWKLIYEHLPKADSFEICTNSKAEDILLCHNSGKKLLTLINIKSKLIKSLPEFGLEGSSQKRFFSQNDCFYIDRFRSILKITLNDDINIEQLAEINNPFSSPLHSLFTKRREEQEKLQKNTPKQYPLKNIKRIYINSKGNIAFDSREYIFKADTIYVQLYHDRIDEQNIEAVVNENGDFEFSNGHTVTENRLGMLILKSHKNRNYPQNIFLPTIEGDIGVASDNDFAGSNYYHIPQSGREQLTFIRFWKQYLQPFIKDIIDYEANYRTKSSK